MDTKGMKKKWNLRTRPPEDFPDCCLVCKHGYFFDDMWKCEHPDVDWGEFTEHYDLCDEFKRIATWDDERNKIK